MTFSPLFFGPLCIWSTKRPRPPRREDGIWKRRKIAVLYYSGISRNSLSTRNQATLGSWCYCIADWGRRSWGSVEKERGLRRDSRQVSENWWKRLKLLRVESKPWPYAIHILSRNRTTQPKNNRRALISHRWGQNSLLHMRCFRVRASSPRTPLCPR